MPDAGAAPAAATTTVRERLPAGTRRNVTVIVAVVLAALAVVQFGFTAHALVGVVLLPALVVLAAIDLEHRVLPNQIVLPVAVALLAILAVDGSHTLLVHAAAAAAAGGAFLLVARVYPPALGMGDVKLAFLLGLALGRSVMSALLIASFAAGIAAIVALVRGGAAARKQTIAFGPYLGLGALVAYFFT
jgi:leader peptidase (prepilin peptidase)/N-methyltransferase